MKRSLSILLVLILICSMILSSCYGEHGASNNDENAIHNNAEIDIANEEQKESDEAPEKEDDGSTSAVTGVIKPEIDRTDLSNEIEVAEYVVEGKTADNYVSNSWQAYVTALDVAKAVQENENATKEEITSAYTALQTAIDQLKINGTTVMFGTYNLSGSTVSDAAAIAKEILQDTSNTVQHSRMKIRIVSFFIVLLLFA